MNHRHSGWLQRAFRCASVAAIGLIAPEGQSEVGTVATAADTARPYTSTAVHLVMEASAPMVLSCMLDEDGAQIVGLDPTRMASDSDISASWILLRDHSQITDVGWARAHKSYTVAELTSLLEWISRCRANYPQVPIAVESLAIADVDPASPTLDSEAPDRARLRRELLQAVSAFSISRTLLILDPLSTGTERRWLLDRYPDLIDTAGDRPVFYSTTWGWRCLRRVPPDSISEIMAGNAAPIPNLTGGGDYETAIQSRTPTSRTPGTDDTTRSLQTQPQNTSVSATDGASTTAYAAPTHDADPPTSTDPVDIVAAAPSHASPGSKELQPTLLGSSGVAGSFSGAPLRQTVGLPRGSAYPGPDGPRLGQLAEPAEYASNTTSPRNRYRGARASAGTTGRPQPPFLDSRSAGPPARVQPSQTLRDLPSWEPDEQQVVIPITPPDSSSPTPPRISQPRPEFDTDVDGWTDFRPFLEPDSRIMYVAANGNDATALVYAPHASPIGDDPMQPIGSVRAFATFEAARRMMRDYKADWILFRRGDQFALPSGLYSHGTNPFFRHDPDGPEIRKVFGAYGPISDPRPIITSISGRLIHGFAAGDLQYANSAFVSLDLRASGVSQGGHAVIEISGNRNLHFEDCRIRGSNTVIAYDWVGDPAPRLPGGLYFKRCVIVDAARSGGGHVQGLYLSNVQGCILEECVFDRNGYVDDPTDPSTWTGKLFTDNASTDSAPPGHGVQPHRTWFSRNLYLSSYSNLYIRGCILSRSASSHQMRVGGVAERNVFIWNDQALAPKTQGGREWLHSQTIQCNLVLHEDHLLAQALQQGGLTASVGSGHRALIHDNVVTGFHRAATYAFGAVGIESYHSYPAQQGDRLTFTDNVAVADHGTLWMIRGTTGPWGNGYRTVEGSGNFGALTTGGIQSTTTELTASTSWRLSSNGFFGGAFRVGDPVNRTAGDLSFLQARGFELGSTAYPDIASLALAAGWRAHLDAQGRRGWERDIVSYMQSIDPNYVVNEDVTVDDGVALARRRSNAPRVWQVLAGLHPSCNTVPMSEDRARLTARRYHAFLTFIERARANRKGYWDRHYTADALNNYIREGFGKPPVSGEFTASLPH